MPNIQPTEQNLAILEAWRDGPSLGFPHLMIDAFAGCGKTTQLQLLAPEIRESSVLVLAFNKRNAEDLKLKLPSRFECSTLNSVGHRALARTMPRGLRVDAEKLRNAVKKISEDLGFGKLDSDDWQTVSGLLKAARSYGLMHQQYADKGWKTLLPDTPETWEELADTLFLDFTPQLHELARAILLHMIQQGTQGTIDYDDQIYLSVLGPAAYTKFQVVAVDEAQDLSKLNHLQLRKSLAAGGRLVVVGDPKQAIYAFRGASTESMGQIEALAPGKFQRLPLSLTFRCPSVVVARQQDHVPGYTAAPSNPKGELIDLRNKDWGLDSLPPRAAILCRNNAPLLSMAFRLIASGRGVTMLGRDIGKNLVKLLEKIVGVQQMPVEEVIDRIGKWREEEVSALVKKGKESLISGIDDRADCLLAVASIHGVANSTEMKANLISLFEDQSGSIVLGTGHRAKGMEWHTVLHLDSWRIPSKFAQKCRDAGDPSQLLQELNLKYVIETRSQHTLMLANLKDFEP